MMSTADPTADELPTTERAKKKQRKYSPLLTTSGGDVDDGVKLNFAQLLMELLEKEDVQPLLHWGEDGKSICFEDPIQFADTVLPKYFNETKYKSFMVRMKRWGFKTITPSDHNGTSKIMSCKLFRRDQPELILLMGDERRVSRVNADKTLTKSAAEEGNQQSQLNVSGVAPEGSLVSSALRGDTNQQSTVAEIPCNPARASTNQERTSLPYPSNLHHRMVALDLARAYQNAVGHGGAGLELNFSPAASLAAAAATRNALDHASGLGSLGGPGCFDSGLNAFESMSLLSIEQEIQLILTRMAVYQDRLVHLRKIRERKMSGFGLGAGSLNQASELMKRFLY